MVISKMNRAEIEKIVEEAHKRVAQRVAPPIALAIPANIPPASVGKYVAKKIEEKYGIHFVSSTTANINAVAAQADKEKMRLSKFSFQLGSDKYPFKFLWEWERKR